MWIPVIISGNTTAEKEEVFDTNKTPAYGYIEPINSDRTGYNEMRTSIINKGGFYIARYEAGYSVTTGRLSTDPSVVITPISKKGSYPYNMVRQADAKASSQSMYNDSTKYGVKSTLCYGVQWNLMLVFLEKLNEADSTSWGNYKNAGPFDFIGEYYSSTYSNGSLTDESWKNNTTTKVNDTQIILKTGATDRNRLKNIYDVAGNVGEWTMESDSYNNHYFSGGRSDMNGVDGRVGSRCTPGGERIAGIGFRPTLYIY